MGETVQWLARYLHHPGLVRQLIRRFLLSKRLMARYFPRHLLYMAFFDGAAISKSVRRRVLEAIVWWVSTVSTRKTFVVCRWIWCGWRNLLQRRFWSIRKRDNEFSWRIWVTRLLFYVDRDGQHTLLRVSDALVLSRTLHYRYCGQKSTSLVLWLWTLSG